MKLIVGPLEAVGLLCGEHRPSHLVSWLSPRDLAPEIAAGLTPDARLHLASHDVCAPGEGLEPPTAGHVAELLAFASDWTGERPLLVHCWAGVSRSTAAAYVIACSKRSDLSEHELAQRLRGLAPTATPNPLIVELADDLLGRGGRMIRAVQAIGRGRETLLGTPFVFELG
jgi:predicted protein tyrosine phosphatase